MIVQRRVSQRGSIMVATQRIDVDMIHARKIVTVTIADHSSEEANRDVVVRSVAQSQR
jgi:hypothetical protein